jgi:hypothetical protein
MLERAPSLNPNAVRSRRKRARRKQGMASFRIEAHEHRLAEALILSTRLSEDEALQRPLIERELGFLIDDWIEKWMRHTCRSSGGGVC